MSPPLLPVGFEPAIPAGELPQTYALDGVATWTGFLPSSPCKISTVLVAVLKLNSVALIRERTIPTERPLPVGEVGANFCG